MQKCQLILRVQDEEVTFNVFQAMEHPMEKEQCLRVDAIDTLMSGIFRQNSIIPPLEAALVHSKSLEDEELYDLGLMKCIKILKVLPLMVHPKQRKVEELKEKGVMKKEFSKPELKPD